jgi:hypothetical protein
MTDAAGLPGPLIGSGRAADVYKDPNVRPAEAARLRRLAGPAS